MREDTEDKRRLVGVSTWVKVALSLLLSGGILWWMYRGLDLSALSLALAGEMRWGWMLASMPFGVAAQVLRAMRWRQSLEPLGERPRLSSCVYAVFLSYASSLVVPRVGEILRCAVLRRSDGVGLSHGVGTVMTERVTDVIVMLLLTVFAVSFEIPVFARFVSRTGMSLASLAGRFTGAGYLVTAVCVLLAIAVGIYFLLRIRMPKGVRGTAEGFVRGLLSVRLVRRKWLFLTCSLGIWVCYFLHFLLAFFSFPFTAGLGLGAAMVAFVAGTYAVLVPTPNGAGAWHFAVKTVLMLYGVAMVDGAMFVLIVHALQTLLVAVLGVYALVALAVGRRVGEGSVQAGEGSRRGEESIS